MNQNSSRGESRFPSKWIHHSYSHIIKQSKQINEWKMPLLPISHSLFDLYKHYLICYSSIIEFIFHDIHATTKTKEYHIFFILIITIVTHHGSYLWCNIHISKYTNVQILNKTGIEPASMRSEIHLSWSYRLTTAHIFRSPTTTPQSLMCSIKK